VPDLKRFIAGTWIDDKKIELLTETDYLKEKFLMGMRTMDGVILDEEKKREQMNTYLLQSSRVQISHAQSHSTSTSKITDILVANREEKVIQFEEQELCEYNGIRLRLTDQ
jgi:coproporphyrinogen III oxidase-like Fe-S oxidoreductase